MTRAQLEAAGIHKVAEERAKERRYLQRYGQTVGKEDKCGSQGWEPGARGLRGENSSPHLRICESCPWPVGTCLVQV